jgi:putative copper export protein
MVSTFGIVDRNLQYGGGSSFGPIWVVVAAVVVVVVVVVIVVIRMMTSYNNIPPVET